MNFKILNQHLLIKIFGVLTFCSIMYGCMLDDKADIDIPIANQELMLEAYLTPGRNFELMLMESNTLSEDLSLLLNWRADINISFGDNTVHLLNILNFEKESKRVFNYGSPILVSSDDGDYYQLSVLTESGKQISARTEIVDSISINDFKIDDYSCTVKFLNDSDPNKRYYSLIIEGYIDGKYTSKRAYLDASGIDDTLISFVEKGNFYKWESLKIKLFHMTRENYLFQTSVNQALGANEDPFSVPSNIQSNIQGGIGIFTYYTVDSLIVR